MTSDFHKELGPELPSTISEDAANKQQRLHSNTLNWNSGPQSMICVQHTNPSNAAEIHYVRNASKSTCGMRKVWGFLGFRKAYNFILCWSLPLSQLGITLIEAVVFSAGAMLGFTLARIPTLNIGGSAASSFKNSASPGDWYYFHAGHYKIGIILHLITILPAGLLMVPQFVPILRHRFPFFHCINGYLVISLVLLANVGALMICRRAFGGGLDIQSAVGVLVILSTAAIGLSYYNIKRLQLDQHRAWILRAIFYVGTIITARVIQTITALIISRLGGYYQIQTCGEVASNYGPIPTPQVAGMYYQCLNASADTNVVVDASFSGQPEQVGASLALGFGMAMWMAILLHLVGVEIYLNLTPGESHQLREVNFERQLEAGLSHPGSAGLTADRLGDAPPRKPRRITSMGSIVET